MPSIAGSWSTFATSPGSGRRERKRLWDARLSGALPARYSPEAVTDVLEPILDLTENAARAHSRSKRIRRLRGAHPRSGIVGFDTEFVSEFYFQPKLCLLQFALPNESRLVDPFEVEDLSAWWSIMADQTTTIVCHGRRDPGADDGRGQATIREQARGRDSATVRRRATIQGRRRSREARRLSGAAGGYTAAARPRRHGAPTDSGRAASRKDARAGLSSSAPPGRRDFLAQVFRLVRQRDVAHLGVDERREIAGDQRDRQARGHQANRAHLGAFLFDADGKPAVAQAEISCACAAGTLSREGDEGILRQLPQGDPLAAGQGVVQGERRPSGGRIDASRCGSSPLPAAGAYTQRRCPANAPSTAQADPAWSFRPREVPGDTGRGSGDQFRHEAVAGAADEADGQLTDFAPAACCARSTAMRSYCSHWWASSRNTRPAGVSATERLLRRNEGVPT